jgi:hypothetical protein
VKVVALFLALALGGAAISGCAEAHPPHNRIAQPYARVHAATHTLTIGKYTCSATGVGHHTLLSASHCFESEPKSMLVDGEACDVQAVLHDGNDHALVTVSCYQRRIVHMGSPVMTGESVFVFGNPEGVTDQLRVGRASGYWTLPKEFWSDAPVYRLQFQAFDFNGGPGDSGAAIFNDYGQIVGVVSIGTWFITAPVQFIGAYPLAFSDEQWASVK